MPFPKIALSKNLTLLGHIPGHDLDECEKGGKIASYLPLKLKMATHEGETVPERRAFKVPPAHQGASKLLSLPTEVLLQIASSRDVAATLAPTCQQGLEISRVSDVMNFRVTPEEFDTLMASLGLPVKSLALVGPFNDHHLKKVPDGLRHLEIAPSAGITPNGLGEFMARATNLKSLTLRGDYTEGHLQALPPTLEHVKIDRSRHVSAQGLSGWIALMTKLRSLTLPNLGYRDAHLACLPESLRELKMPLSAAITKPALSQLLGRLKRLESLEMKGLAFTDDVLDALPRSLRRLTLQVAPEATPLALSGLERTRLHSVSVDSSDLDEAQAMAIAGISTLETVDLSGTGGGVTPAVARQLGLNPNLVRLDLVYNNLRDDCIAELSRAQLELENDASLAWLDLCGNDLTNGAVHSLRLLPALKMVDLGSNPRISREVLKTLLAGRV